MQLLMLSGNSLANKTWIYQAKEQFSDLFDNFYVQDYKHWVTGEELIDLTHELKALGVNRPKFDREYGVFAKSIGTVLAVQAMQRGIIKPKWLLLCGIPLGYIEKEYPEFAAAAAAAGVPLTIVHNEHDEVGAAVAVAAYMDPLFAGRQDYRFVTTAGDNHKYENYEVLRTELTHLRD